MTYTIQDSLKNIEADSLARAMVAYPEYNTSQYSFLPQYSSQPQRSPYQRQPVATGQDMGSTSFGRTGSLSSGMGRSYANYPTVPMPTLSPIETPKLTSPELPVYTSPERDEKRLQGLQQKAAAPGLARARRGLERGIQSTRSIDNPTERKYHLTGMLEEYGLGLGDIISKADVQGLNEYEREYATQLDQAKTRYGADVTETMSKAEIENQNLMNRYQQDLADRNAMFGLQSQIFGNQGIQKQAEAFAGETGGGGMMIAGQPYITGNKSPQWRGYGYGR